MRPRCVFLNPMRLIYVPEERPPRPRLGLSLGYVPPVPSHDGATTTDAASRWGRVEPGSGLLGGDTSSGSVVLLEAPWALESDEEVRALPGHPPEAAGAC